MTQTNETGQRHKDLWTLALDRICGDDQARRELLWLRAHESGDGRAAELLERIDPTLRERMRSVEAEYLARGFELDSPESRRHGYGRMYDDCYRRHARRLLGAPASGPCAAA
ncbi:MAG: hypothetical protein HY744_07395 [Deltaproteobacteria bacterium]|nr:hypothetical protein [Deltaproteobacteria bacterium]